MKLSFTNVDRIYVLFIFVRKNVYKKLSLKSAETLNLQHRVPRLKLLKTLVFLELS